ncbi:MAG TPA: PAS domain S-box protein [Vicinamibacterales bacterium]|nr:PAS domain S-box protein [Vicinamibacterales bacterium]
MASRPARPDDSPTNGTPPTRRARSRRLIGAWRAAALFLGLAVFAGPAQAAGQPRAPSSSTAHAARPIVYGGSATFPPFEFLDAHGRPAGFNVALIRELARRAHRPLTIRLGKWPQILDDFQHGRVDIIAAPVLPARSAPDASLGQVWTLQEGLVFFQSATPPSAHLDDMAGSRLILMAGAAPAAIQARLTAVQRREAHVVDTPNDAIRLAHRQPGLVIVGDRLSLRDAALRGDLPSPLFVPLSMQPYGLVVSAARAAEFAWAHAALTGMWRDGTISRLAEQLLAPPHRPDRRGPSVRDLLVLFATFLIFLGIAIAGNRSLRHQINAHSSRLARTVEEKVRLSEALSTSHDRYRLLVQSVEDYAIFLLTPEGSVASWNVGAERVSGYAAEEALGLPFARFYPLDEVDGGEPARALQRAAADGRFECEGWRVRRDGSRFWATVVLRTLRDDGGALRGYSCITRDVTERRRAETKLAFQARVLSQVNEPIVGIDANGRVTYWNSGAERLYGVLAADAMGRPLSEIYTLKWIQPDDEPRAKATFAATGSWLGEQIHCLRSGENVYVESFISILTDDHGTPVGSLAAARDVSDRRRAREALQARARQQAALAGLSQRALAESDVEALLAGAVHAVVETLGVDCAKILELQDDGQALLLRAGTGWRDGLVGHATVCSDPTSQAGYTLMVDEPVIVADLPSESRFTDQDLLAPHDIVSGVSVIIRTPDRPYGVLSAHSRSARTFTTDDVHFLEAVANVLGVTLQRSRVEAALRESEANYRLLMERASDGIILADPSGQILTANSRACEMLGYTVDEARRLGLHELLASEAPPTLPLRLMEVPAGQTALTERQLRRKDGSLLPVEISAKLLDDGRVQAIVRDITERKRAGEEITRALSLLSATLEATTDGILTVDGQSRITSFNRRFVEMWQVPDDLIGAHEADLVIQFAANQLKNGDVLLAQAAELGGHAETETGELLELKDGRVFEASSRPQRLGATCVGRVWSFRNVTERQRLQAQVQHAQKLESLGVLAGGIAHDFNNLLLGVLGHAGLARMELAAESPIQNRLEQIELTAQRAAELTNQMLAYSGKGRFVVQPLDLSNLVHEMAHLLHSVISKKADLRFDFAPGLPAVNADVSQLRQVVMNLITNASDALGEHNGTITIRTGLVHVDAHYLSDTYVNEASPEGPYVFVEVSDSGCGMDGPTRARIFDPFFTTKFTGRGLGLAAVLGIVRGHHGAIKVYSEPGLGTTFKVLLPPAQRPAQATSRPDRTRDTWHSGGLVLVVDDEEGVRTVAQGVLERCGFSVLEARDGLEGVDVFRAHAADIRAVLLDMTMPRMGGVEALREIRRIRHDVPVILSSGYSEEDAVDHVRVGTSELSGFIQKPYAATGLVDKLREVLEA